MQFSVGAIPSEPYKTYILDELTTFKPEVPNNYDYNSDNSILNKPEEQNYNAYNSENFVKNQQQEIRYPSSTRAPSQPSSTTTPSVVSTAASPSYDSSAGPSVFTTVGSSISTTRSPAKLIMGLKSFQTDVSKEESRSAQNKECIFQYFD